MNKLEGLYELKKLSIPTIDWECYNHETKLDDKCLWTIRTAVFSGYDLSLPRLFGKDADTSKRFADEILNKIGDKGIVIYYPYLIAEKSGNLQFSQSKIIIEAVEGDLVNLLDGKKVDVTYIWDQNERQVIGNENFLSPGEQHNILSYVEYLRRKYAHLLMLGKEIQLEYSFAYDCSKQGQKIGKQKLVFFEIRTV